VEPNKLANIRYPITVNTARFIVYLLISVKCPHSPQYDI
jgi:hypothetical protein